MNQSKRCSENRKVESTVHNDKGNKVEDDKGEEDDKDGDESIVSKLENHYNEQ